jgi:hypothetical protein
MRTRMDRDTQKYLFTFISFFFYSFELLSLPLSNVFNAKGMFPFQTLTLPPPNTLSLFDVQFFFFKFNAES